MKCFQPLRDVLGIMSSEDILFGTVVPFSWYRGCCSVSAMHFSDMARQRCNSVRIDVSDEDLVTRMQEVSAVVQLATAARLKPVLGLCGFAGMLGRGALPRCDADSSPFLSRHAHSRKVDGSGVQCSGQVCTRDPEFIDYACALCCAVGCIRGLGGISLVHPNFSMCFCRLCVDGGAEGDAQNDSSRNRFRYKRKMPVLPDEDDERDGLFHSSAFATLHLLQAMFLSFRTAPLLSQTSSATAIFGRSLIKANQVDMTRAVRVLELSPQPSVMQPAMEVMLGSVPAATHIVIPLPCSVVPHQQLANASMPSALHAPLPERKYTVQPRSASQTFTDAAAEQEEEQRPSSDGCCWDVIALCVETTAK